MFSTRAPVLIKVFVTVMMALLVLVAGVVASPNQSEAARRSRFSFKKVEKCMLNKINKRRVRHGQGRLHWDRQMSYVARKHAKKMARSGSIFHDENIGYEITRWRALGENVGVGGSCKSLFRAFMDSSPHRHNILGKWRFVGVGSERRNGRLYVHHVFEHRVNPGNVYAYP